MRVSYHVRSNRAMKKTELTKKATQHTNVAEVCHLLLVSDSTTSIRFLVDSGAQISILPAQKMDILKGTRKSTLQNVIKLFIQTYSHRCLTLNVDQRRNSTYVNYYNRCSQRYTGQFFFAYIWRAYWYQHKLFDTETNIKSPGFIYNNIQFDLVMADTKYTTLFFEILKKFEGTKTVFP